MRSKFINKEDVQKLRKCMHGNEWLPLQLMLETGLRVGDAVRVKVRDISNEEGKYYLSYTAEKTKKKGKCEISPGLAKKLTEGKRRSAYCFGSYGSAGHLTRQAVWHRMKKAALAAGISEDGCSPHSLRKIFAVALLHEKGLQAVQKALQHSNDAVTRIYAYSDTVVNFAPDEPIRWCNLELIVSYILDRLKNP